MPRGKNNANNNRNALPQSESKGSSGGKSDICIPFLTGKCSFEKGCRKRHPSKEEIPRVLARYKKTRCKFRDECYTEGCLFLHPKEEAQRKEPNFIAAHHFPPLCSDTCTSVRSSSPDSASKQSSQQQSSPSDSAWSKNPPAVVADVSPTKQIATSHQGTDSPTMVTAWGNPNQTNGPPPIMVNVPPPQQPMAAYPTQQGYYACPPPPIPPMMAPNMAPPAIDPNTGYPIDPSAYYYDQQSFYYHQQQLHQVSNPYPINGMMGPPMGVPFNAEAKEFVPGMSTPA